jgi:hypothetical protein
MSEQRKNMLASIVVLLLVLLLGANVLYPTCQERSDNEGVLRFLSIAIPVVTGNLYLLLAYISRTKADTVRCALVILLGVLTTVSESNRADKVVQLLWSFNGTVTEKYRSTNHGARSIRIESSGEDAFEFVAEQFWDQVKVGDRVEKHKCSKYVLLNGRETQIVP